MKVFEPFLDDRIEEARKKAQRILMGQAETEEELRYVLIMVIEREKKLGMFSSYYEERTLDELVFEAELTKGVIADPIEAAAETIAKASAEEKAELSMDMANFFGDNLNEDFLKDAMSFMETGDFKGVE